MWFFEPVSVGFLPQRQCLPVCVSVNLLITVTPDEKGIKDERVYFQFRVLPHGRKGMAKRTEKVEYYTMLRRLCSFSEDSVVHILQGKPFLLS